MKRMLTISAAVLTFVVAPLAAAPITYYAVLNGPSEAPPNASPGVGLTQVVVDPVANTLQIWASFAGLTTGTTASHIHVINGPGDTNTADTAGPVATTTPTFAGFPLGVTSGNYFNTLDLTQASSFNATFVTAAGGLAPAQTALLTGISQGRAYLNIHTSQFPGGEIRGFLVAVPEPGSMTLIGGGFVGLIVLYRRRKRA